MSSQRSLLVLYTSMYKELVMQPNFIANLTLVLRNTNRLDRIHAENLRTCVQRDYWYQTALGRLRQRGQGIQEHVEGASVEGASVEGASAPERETRPPLYHQNHQSQYQNQ